VPSGGPTVRAAFGGVSDRLATTQGGGAAYRYSLQLLHRQSSNIFDAKSASKYIDTMRDRADNQATTALAAATGSTDPEIGLRAVSVLRGLVETLEALQVDNARAKGWSWQQIATLLGLTKQAVHHKHGPHAKGRDVPRRSPP
jgi:hypothetical protein